MAVQLTYFDMSGLGEPVRVMLSYGQIEFEDKRIKQHEWIKLKTEMKFGQVPRLIIDGLELYQSRAICRYVADKLNLRGKDPKEAAVADMWVDTFDDMRQMVVRWYYQPDSKERTDSLEKIKNSDLRGLLNVYEKPLDKDESKFFIGNQVSWADVMFFAYMSYISELLSSSAEDLLASNPRLLDIYQTIKSSPGIQKWLKTRPESPADMRALFK